MLHHQRRLKQDTNKHKQHGGKDLGYQGEQASQMFNNNLSVNANPGTTLAKVNKEISLNRIAGPFKGYRTIRPKI